jgi:transposase
LIDLDKRIIVDILESRKKENLIAHFQSFGASFCEQTTNISCDYWQAYSTIIQTFFPTATIVLDRFHVVKLLNNCVDTFRKLLIKSEAENVNYRRLSDKELDELDLCVPDCPMLKDIYWAREQFHHMLDNARQVEVVVQKTEQ